MEIKKILQTLKIQDDRIDELISNGLTDNLIHNTKLILSSESPESPAPPFTRDNTPTSDRITTSEQLILQYNGGYNYMTIEEYFKVVQYIKRNLVGGRKRRSRARTNKKRTNKKRKSKKNKSKRRRR